MIEGLKIKISGIELSKHLNDRAAHHRTKRDWYKDQVISLRAGGLAESAVTNDPINSLERSRDQHEQKATFFAFMADHLELTEDYQLTERDLEQIEIFSRYF